jgi:hypothetical protein
MSSRFAGVAVLRLRIDMYFNAETAILIDDVTVSTIAVNSANILSMQCSLSLNGKMVTIMLVTNTLKANNITLTTSSISMTLSFILLTLIA